MMMHVDARFSLRPSALHGLGVFANVLVTAGEFVAEHEGIAIDSNAVVDGQRVMQIGKELYLAEHPHRHDCADYINHGCEPNLGFTDGTLRLFALRDIKAGEELLWDYSTCMNEAGWTIRCVCGASTCRGAITSYCDLTVDHRRRLKAIALNYLRSSETL